MVCFLRFSRKRKATPKRVPFNERHSQLGDPQRVGISRGFPQKSQTSIGPHDSMTSYAACHQANVGEHKVEELILGQEDPRFRAKEPFGIESTRIIARSSSREVGIRLPFFL